MGSLSRLFFGVTACAAIVIVGCGDDDSGTPDYTDPIVKDQKFEEPDPYVEGKERLSVDVFYEGGRSETLYVNEFRTHFFIFGELEFGRKSFLLEEFGDRLEGEMSHKITLVGAPFWGGGLVYDEPVDLSEWKKLFVSFKSSDRSFETFQISLLYGTEDDEGGVMLDPRAYGYTNDGEWHSLEIDLQDAIDRGFDPTRVRSPFIIGASGGESGDTLLVDNLYLTKF